MSTSTTALPDRAPRPFDTDAYLAQYYDSICSENDFLLRFYHRAFAAPCDGGRMLELGGGPTLYQLISASRVVDEIVFAEYEADNRARIRQWLDAAATAYDWEPYFARVAAWEGSTARALEQRLRNRIRRLTRCDLTRTIPVPGELPRSFDLLNSAFCIESVAASPDELHRYFSRCCSLLRPGGRLLGVSVRNCSAYLVGDDWYHAYALDEAVLAEALAGAGLAIATLETFPTDDRRGYDGIIAFDARLTGEPAAT